MSLREFLDYQNPSLTESEAFELYSTYKKLFKQARISAFFEAHKEEAWFIEKFHPKYSEKYLELKQKELEARALDFRADFEAGKFEQLDLDTKTNAEGSVEEENEEEKVSTVAEVSPQAIPGMTACSSHIILIKNIPPNIFKDQVIDFCQTVPGFKYVSFSEPNPQKNFQRVAWVVFSDDIDMNSVYQKMENMKVILI